MKNTKVIISLIMVVSILTFICSCDIQGSGDVKKSDSIKNGVADERIGTVTNETEQTITVIDQAGREVTVSKDIQSIALCYRVVLRFLLNLDQGEKIKGVGKIEDFVSEIEPGLKECADVGKGVADIEALAELEPDIFFHKASDEKTLDSVKKIGIPAVGINVETPEDMKQAIDLMGKLCGAEEKAAKLTACYDDKLAEFEKLTSSIADDEKKTAIMMGSSLGEVADGSMLQGQMIEYGGGINLAKKVETTELWPMVGIEKIFSWDPDYIFITNSSSTGYTVKDILNKKEWQELTAVKNKNVYIMPAKEDSWEFPGVVSILGMEYIMKTMYPDLISDKKLVKDVNELYKLSYGKEFSRKELGY